MEFLQTLSGLDTSELERMAGQLLRLLDGMPQAAAVVNKTEAEGEPGAVPRRGMAFLPVEIAGRAQRNWDPAEDSGRTVPEESAEDASERLTETVALPDTEPRSPVAIPEPESAGAVSARQGSVFSVMRSSTGSDMDAISEFFRRDSRRYDTGFGE